MIKQQSIIIQPQLPKKMHPTKTTKNHLIKLPSKATNSQLQQSSLHIIYSLSHRNFCVFDLEYRKIIYKSNQIHQNKIGCLRNKDNLLFTGGYDQTVKMFDCRTWQLLHTFQKIPSKFNSIDKSQHILAGATGSNIIFWDLRKNKQRCQFKSSFNDTVTHLRFELEHPTNLLACSIDGMISMFDLTQPNQQQSFSWCHKILGSQGKVLLQTTDHILFKILDSILYGKIQVNKIDNPKHIIQTQFQSNTNNQQYQYFVWLPQNQVVELWQGNFLDKNNQEICHLYLSNVVDIQVFNSIVNKSDNYIGVYTDEQGNIYQDYFHNQLKQYTLTTNPYHEKQSKKHIKLSPPKKQKKYHLYHHNQPPSQLNNKNGYILNKPPSLFSNNKKYKPY